MRNDLPYGAMRSVRDVGQLVTPLVWTGNLHGMLGKERTPDPFAPRARADAEPDVRIPSHLPLQEAGSPAPEEKHPERDNFKASRRQFLEIFPYGTIELPGALLASTSYRTIRRSLWP